MKELICIVCPRGCHLLVDEEHGYAVSGNSCQRGEEYGKAELTRPTRVVTSTVCVAGAAYPRCPVKTNAPILKGEMFRVMDEIAKVRLKAPVHIGQVLIQDICGTKADLVATCDLPALG